MKPSLKTARVRAKVKKVIENTDLKEWEKQGYTSV